jgi:hypothetical protein
MKTRMPLRSASLALGVVLVTGAVNAQSCEPIHFKRGSYSGTVEGVAPAEDVVCYELATGAGQRATVKVTGKNVIFSIGGVIDAQDEYSFTTKKQTYRIIVGQLMRSITKEPFTLTVSVR